MKKHMLPLAPDSSGLSTKYYMAPHLFEIEFFASRTKHEQLAGTFSDRVQMRTESELECSFGIHTELEALLIRAKHAVEMALWPLSKAKPLGWRYCKPSSRC